MRNYKLISFTLTAALMFIAQKSWSGGPSIAFGHNLTPTIETLPAGRVTFGNYALGVGVTDRVTLATSPWLYASYNMYSAVVRVRGCLNFDEHGDCQTAWGTQAMYLKTGHMGKNVYQMTALTDSFVIKQVIDKFYDVNFAVNYMYFFDETSPFSLRREPYNGDAYQWSATILQNVKLPAHFGLLVETGFLGLNYVYPEIHIGISMYHKWIYTLVQIGFSQTFTSGSIAGMFTTDQGQTVVKGEPGKDFSMHPEVQLQFFF